MMPTIFASKWAVLGAFVIKGAAIMVLIALAAVATPYIARLIDKHRKPIEKINMEDKVHNERSVRSEQDVRGIFDASCDEDFDPNYKIYNTDIYGWGRQERNDNKNGEE